MSTGYQQGNRGNQGRIATQQTTQVVKENTAAGTPATAVVEDKLTTQEENRVANALKLGQEQEEQKEQEQEEDLTIKEQFHALLIRKINEVHTGFITPAEAKADIRLFFTSLDSDIQGNNRMEFKDIGGVCLHQVEELVQELPVLLM